MSILDKIIEQKRLEVTELYSIYSARALKPGKSRPSLFEGLKKAEEMAVIAEVKRASPSEGMINEEVDPVEQAGIYQKAGASAISVLTDREFFKGSLADLASVSDAVAVPLLCKDFMIDEVQIDAAAEHGASVILLIAAALEDQKLRSLHQYAAEHGLDVLLEVHDEKEAERALNAGAKLIGINNRNLKTFDVDLAVTERVAGVLKGEDIVIISESGIKTQEDVVRVRDAGAKGVLVGETLMRAADVPATLESFRIPLGESIRL